MNGKVSQPSETRPIYKFSYFQLPKILVGLAVSFYLDGQKLLLAATGMKLIANSPS